VSEGRGTDWPDVTDDDESRWQIGIVWLFIPLRGPTMGLEEASAGPVAKPFELTEAR